jgi:hypothetical protein
VVGRDYSFTALYRNFSHAWADGPLDENVWGQRKATFEFVKWPDIRPSKPTSPGGPSGGAGRLPCRPPSARRSLRLSPVVAPASPRSAVGAGGIAPPCYHASDADYTEKNGRVYLMSEDVEFTFVDDPEEQPQASAFWPLIEGDEEVILWTLAGLAPNFRAVLLMLKPSSIARLMPSSSAWTSAARAVSRWPSLSLGPP